MRDVVMNALVHADAVVVTCVCVCLQYVPTCTICWEYLPQFSQSTW